MPLRTETPLPGSPGSAANETLRRLHALLASPWLWLVFLALGCAARCRQYLAGSSYWYDEAYLLLNIFQKSFTDLLGPLDYSVVLPPLFLWLLRGAYTTLGGSELAMRLPALVTGLAAVGLMVPLGRRLVGGAGWVAAAALVAVSDHALFHACEVRAYSADLLVTEVVLLAATLYLDPAAGPRSRARAFLLLGAAALVGPWLSFPSAFVLAGASLALLAAALRDGDRPAWCCWGILNLLLLLSGLTLWYLSARHLYYPGLREHWEGWNGFPDLSSARAALAWVGACLAAIADYGTSGMAVPLLALAAGGLVVLARRSGPTAILLVAPLVAALAAAFLRKYPLSDRTVLFLTPCLWLLAAAGLDALLRHPRPAARGTAFAALLLLLAPGTARMVKYVVVSSPRLEYREALAHVRTHWAAGDAVWVLHPEVYRVYHSQAEAPLGYYTPSADVLQAAGRGRLWLVTAQGRSYVKDFPDLFAGLESPSFLLLERHHVKGLEVRLYTAAPGEQQVARLDAAR